MITNANGAICISKEVADQLSSWVTCNTDSAKKPFSVDWFHLGADIASSVPSKGLPNEAAALLLELNKRPSFLMVGTLEPRKGHVQTLNTVEKLWDEGLDINLVIVGKSGWVMESLVERLRYNTELGKRLFWLEGISDEYLEKIYATSTCLIAASEGIGIYTS